MSLSNTSANKNLPNSVPSERLWLRSELMGTQVITTCVPINSDLNHKRSLGTELGLFLFADVLDKLINTFLSF